MTTIYNEIDPFAVRWLRNLIAAGHVAPGVVDERSISDLVATDVAGLGQRHFFAGIAGWSLALRLAGVPDDADVWTGSCPCQSLSDAGNRRGFTDARHLWPRWFGLIRECRPAVVFGEQVASGLGWSWLDLVFADLEGASYVCAAANLPAASVGAPHRRQRIFFVAYADRQSGRLLAAQRQPGRANTQAQRSGEAGELGIATGARRGSAQVARPDLGDESSRAEANDRGTSRRAESQRAGAAVAVADDSAQRMGDSGGAGGRRDSRAVSGAKAEGSGRRRVARRVADVAVAAGSDSGVGDSDDTRLQGQSMLAGSQCCKGTLGSSGSIDGWSDCGWIPCSDGVSRPVEPGTHPLAHGISGRVGLLRGYGNAIVPEAAAAFIVAALEAA